MENANRKRRPIAIAYSFFFLEISLGTSLQVAGGTCYKLDYTVRHEPAFVLNFQQPWPGLVHRQSWRNGDGQTKTKRSSSHCACTPRSLCRAALARRILALAYIHFRCDSLAIPGQSSTEKLQDPGGRKETEAEGSGVEVCVGRQMKRDEGEDSSGADTK